MGLNINIVSMAGEVLLTKQIDASASIQSFRVAVGSELGKPIANLLWLNHALVDTEDFQGAGVSDGASITAVMLDAVSLSFRSTWKAGGGRWSETVIQVRPGAAADVERLAKEHRSIKRSAISKSTIV